MERSKSLGERILGKLHPDAAWKKMEAETPPVPGSGLVNEQSPKEAKSAVEAFDGIKDPVVDFKSILGGKELVGAIELQTKYQAIIEGLTSALLLPELNSDTSKFDSDYDARADESSGLANVKRFLHREAKKLGLQDEKCEGYFKVPLSDVTKTVVNAIFEDLRNKLEEMQKTGLQDMARMTDLKKELNELYEAFGVFQEECLRNQEIEVQRREKLEQFKKLYGVLAEKLIQLMEGEWLHGHYKQDIEVLKTIGEAGEGGFDRVFLHKFTNLGAGGHSFKEIKFSEGIIQEKEIESFKKFLELVNKSLSSQKKVERGSDEDVIGEVVIFPHDKTYLRDISVLNQKEVANMLNPK